MELTFDNITIFKISKRQDGKFEIYARILDNYSSTRSLSPKFESELEAINYLKDMQKCLPKTYYNFEQDKYVHAFQLKKLYNDLKKNNAPEY